MYETLKRLYSQGKIDATGLEKAIEKKWITREQYEEIILNCS